MTSNVFVSMSIDDLIQIIRENIKAELQANFQVPNSIPPEELLCTDEVAALLRVSKVTIHKWKKSKLIQFYRIGRRIYFKKNEMLAAMHSINSKKTRSFSK